MSDSKPQVSSLKLYFRLLSYVKPYIFFFAISIIGYMIFASSQPLLAHILQYFVDALSGKSTILFPGIPYLEELNLIYAVPVFLILIAVWQGIGSFLGSYFLARVTLGLVQDLRLHMFKKFFILPSRYFDDRNSGHMVSLILFNVNMVTGAATDAIKVIFREGLTVVFLFSYLLYMNWRLTLVMVAILPLIAVMVTIAGKKFRKQSKKIQMAMGDLTHVTSETVQNYRVVRSFGGEEYESKRFKQVTEDSTAKQLKMTKTGAIYTPLLQLVIYSAMAVLLFFVLALRGDASAGELIAYITAAGLLPKPIRQLSEVSSNVQKGLAGAESIFEVLDEAPEVDNGTIIKEKVRGKLEFKNLAFTYPDTDKQVLKDISFTIEPGQMIALVGRSGSGKSTLANLIPRFYQHDKGSILLDDIDINDYKLANLRQHISLVTQQVSLFNTTVFKNIAYGTLSNYSLDQVKESTRAAYADDFIEALTDGYDTLIGENGVKLSGGQRQRLSISRALLKNAPLLILDEATSSLDTESERHIQDALDRVMDGRTTLVIAHRLSTIEKADIILVMENGSIIERGTHGELLALGGAYANLHAMGFKENHDQNKNEEN